MAVPERLHVATQQLRYKQQRWHCRSRSIPFLLTYEQWWALWKPKWKKRGRKKGQYVMARFGDAGAYEIGNVEIILCEDNHRQIGGRTLPPRSALHCQRISLAHQGKRLTEKHKRKIGVAVKKYWEAQRVGA